MDENEMLGVDEGEGTGTGDMDSVGSTEQIIIDTSGFALEIAVLEEKFDTFTEKVTVLTEKVTAQPTISSIESYKVNSHLKLSKNSQLIFFSL